MNTKTLNSAFIAAVKASLPSGTHLSNAVTDILGLGKEAAYRRLRSEVPFTFEEAAMIARELGISLDRLAVGESDKMAIFDLHVMRHEDPMETYYRAMSELLHYYKSVKGDPDVEWYTASNVVPHCFYMDHDYLSRFLLFKWMYQQVYAYNFKYFRDLVVPEKIRDMQLDYIETTKSLASATFIWDEMMFVSLLNELRYFCHINLITDKEKEVIKAELHSMIDILEDLAGKGHHENGCRVFFYVSSINFEASYSYLTSSTVKLSSIRLYSINTISTTDRHVFEHQQGWIQSLKKYSTLISVSGEMQRVQFLKKQRAYINDL
ncbi:MAG: hypothetical protein LBI58_04365 [Tannerellaceae bacterium]|jgi:hypothetical protein|nr:hypothetical protein [Tannerellaceae bacterium]